MLMSEDKYVQQIKLMAEQIRIRDEEIEILKEGFDRIETASNHIHSVDLYCFARITKEIRNKLSDR